MFTFLIIACLVSLLCFVPLANASDANLVSVNDGLWWADIDSNKAPVRNMQISYKVNFMGEPSWEVPLSYTVDWGVDRGMFDIFPGDHIVWSCWIKTSEPTVLGDNYLAGGRIGIDLYGDNGASFGIGDLKGLGVTENIANTFVVFGTDVWTKVTIDFIVDDSYRANQVTNGQGLGTLFKPTGCCIWIQTWSCKYYASEYGTAWFAHPELYINHSYNNQIDNSGISAFTAVAFLSATILILRKQLIGKLFINRTAISKQRTVVKNTLERLILSAKILHNKLEIR